MSQQQTKLQQLCQYLATSLTPAVKANDIDAWQERGQLIISGEDLGEGFCLAKWKYSATVLIERFPHQKINPYTLLALMASWLITQNEERDEWGMADPDIDIDIISDDNCTIIIDVELMDDIEIIEDQQGPIEFIGKRYRVATVPIYLAESAEVVERSQ